MDVMDTACSKSMGIFNDKKAIDILAFVVLGFRKTQTVPEHDFVGNKVLVHHVV
jgi:hypothetical protein